MAKTNKPTTTPAAVPETYDSTGGRTPGQLIDDLTSLDVVTLIGDLSVVTSGDGDDGVNVGDVYRRIAGQRIAEDSRLNLLAVTHVALDKDTVTFIKQPLSAEEKELLQYHLDSVRAAGEARSAMAAGIARLLPLKGRG